MTHGAVIGHVVHFVEMTQRNAAPGLLLVEEGLDDETRRQHLVTRRVKQVGAGNVGVAHRLALAAAQAVLDHGVEIAQFAGLQNQGFLLHQSQ